MLARLVADPLDDPMTPEVVSVPTRGIERWLTQRLSMHLGCAREQAGRRVRQHRVPLPRDVGRRSVGAARRVPIRKADPWVPERAVWPLIEVVEEHFDEPWLAPLAQHIRNSATVEGSRRFSSIRHVADLFDRYAVHRPDMLQRWAAGSPQLDETQWQFELWRLLRERLGEQSPAERLVEACRRLRGGARALGPADSALTVRADQASGQLPRRPGGHRCSSGRAPLLVAPVSGAVGTTGTRGRPVVTLRPSQRRSDRGRAAQPAPRVVGARRAGDAARAGGAEEHGEHAAPRRGGPSARLCSSSIQDDIRADRAPMGEPGGSAVDERPTARSGRRQHPRPLLPRPGSPGRGAARRDLAPARGRCHSRAPRHHRHVS